MKRMKVLVGIVLLVLVAIVGAMLYGRSHWQAATTQLQRKLQACRLEADDKRYEQRQLEGLPAPVQRYFGAVLIDGQPLVETVTVAHTGSFNMGDSTEQWKPFSSTQRVITQRPGFIWDARIQMVPGLPIFVHDGYVAGEGVLTAKLFGFLKVMEQPSTPELAQGELMRFVAEAAWYPTALLPREGVVWQALSDTQATLTWSDGATTIRLEVQFDEQGLISSVRSDERYREVGGALVKTPWQGRFWNYERRDGMLIPLEGEVSWLLPSGPKPYWRGRIQQIAYEFAG